LALGEQAVAVTADSPSLASGELENALQVAKQIGVRHEIIRTFEMSDPNYTRNDSQRCYFCKSELYGRLTPLQNQLGLSRIVNGANLDDVGDYRPGMQAASEANIRSPLIECRIDKASVRALAQYWCLPVWDKPATPCLSSRIAYGEQVTPERLRQVDEAEKWLRNQGLTQCRVRWHKGELARIEVPCSELERFCSEPLRNELIQAFRQAGFLFVTLDLEGFRSGSLNQLVSIQKSST
jgi:pyridinium-3,5-biscarboxylic acid mononucleotide sulfurtransferase